jgi:hypothetical protein
MSDNIFTLFLKGLFALIIAIFIFALIAPLLGDFLSAVGDFFEQIAVILISLIAIIAIVIVLDRVG